MARRPLLPGAIGRLNATRYEIAKDGEVDLDSLFGNNESEKENRLKVDKKEK